MPSLLPSSELSVCPELSAHPELSICPEKTTEVVPLSLVLSVLRVALWCVWAAHTIPNPPEDPELYHHLCTSPHHLLCCLLAAPLLTLSLPSVQNVYLYTVDAYMDACL